MRDLVVEDVKKAAKALSEGQETEHYETSRSNPGGARTSGD